MKVDGIANRVGSLTAADIGGKNLPCWSVRFHKLCDHLLFCHVPEKTVLSSASPSKSDQTQDTGFFLPGQEPKGLSRMRSQHLGSLVVSPRVRPTGRILPSVIILIPPDRPCDNRLDHRSTLVMQEMDFVNKEKLV